MISDNNTRVLITIDKKLHKYIKTESKKENRSISNYIVNILNKNVEEE